MHTHTHTHIRIAYTNRSKEKWYTNCVKRALQQRALNIILIERNIRPILIMWKTCTRTWVAESWHMGHNGSQSRHCIVTYGTQRVTKLSLYRDTWDTTGHKVVTVSWHMGHNGSQSRHCIVTYGTQWVTESSLYRDIWDRTGHRVVTVSWHMGHNGSQSRHCNVIQVTCPFNLKNQKTFPYHSMGGKHAHSSWGYMYMYIYIYIYVYIYI
jgi:hypothetical protein